jgi:hypothetical protein
MRPLKEEFSAKFPLDQTLIGPSTESHVIEKSIAALSYCYEISENFPALAVLLQWNWPKNPEKFEEISRKREKNHLPKIFSITYLSFINSNPSLLKKKFRIFFLSQLFR